MNAKAQPDVLASSLAAYLSVTDITKNHGRYHNPKHKCETQLGKPGHHRKICGVVDTGDLGLFVLWLILADGARSLLDIVKRSRCYFALVDHATINLAESHLLKHYGEIPTGEGAQ